MQCILKNNDYNQLKCNLTVPLKQLQILKWIDASPKIIHFHKYFSNNLIS